MKIAIILNGISLKKKFVYHEILPAIKPHYEVEVFETRTQNDAVLLASKAADKHFDVIIAAGGDGTVHQVLNGILEGREGASNLPVLGIIPIGSGNDLARALKLEADTNEFLELLKTQQPRTIDIGKVSYHIDSNSNKQTSRYFVNEVDIGMGPEVVKKVMSSGRPFGPSVAYYLAILSTFITFKPLHARVTTPTWNWEGKIRTLAIANGNYYGHGLCISPDSQPDDGLFGTFICSGVSVFDFIRYSETLKKGKHVRIPEIMYNEAKAIELTSSQTVPVEADGEILGYLPAKIEMLPLHLKVLA